MEGSVGEEDKLAVKSGGSAAGQGEIQRTQSSLELLSDTALASMDSNGKNKEEEQEEAGSARSGDNSVVSARVTPSNSQSSMGLGAFGGNENNSKSTSDPGGTQKLSVGTMTSTSPVNGNSSGQLKVDTSPLKASEETSQSPVPVGVQKELPGLPIDHCGTSTLRSVPTYAVPPQQRTYLPESYLPQPDAYFNQAPYYPGPTSQSSLPLLPHPEYAATSYHPSQAVGPNNQATHAAFMPPRSVAPRSQQQQHAMAHHPHFTAVPHHHEQQHPHYRLVHPGVVNPCDSFHSDSTASLSSESKLLSSKKFKTAATPPRSTPYPHGHVDEANHDNHVPVIKSFGAKDAVANHGDMAEANQRLRQENIELKHELEKRDKEIAVLRLEVRELDLKVKELRQFPAGKISQIPMADMMEIMSIYGSEVSDTVMPPRKMNIQKASVIRQFRRWNPNFIKYFFFKDGKWHPKLGREGELARRQQTRKKGKGKQAAVNNPENSPVASPESEGLMSGSSRKRKAPEDDEK